jgi:DNA-binding response OmpR family regulator
MLAFMAAYDTRTGWSLNCIHGDPTPVLMLTSLGEEADQVRAFRLDADQYVVKPFRLIVNHIA